MKFFTTEFRPIQSWCDSPEEGCLAQARNLANLPFTFRKVCLMPDTHQGYGMPVGGVLALQGVIIPNAVGVDIGCGMSAFKTDLPVAWSENQEQLKAVMGKIRELVPVGFNWHKTPQPMGELEKTEGLPTIKAHYEKASQQLGTLGGGNHFIEIQKGSDGFIWFMLHSGSRNLGKQVADVHNKRANEINRKYNSSVPEEWELAFLPWDTEEAQLYIKEMMYCLDFAKANRALMCERIEDAFHEITMCNILERIDIHHNYARMENHFGQNVMVHRKGATSAKEGELGIIPGSQGTASYIVKGKGNKESFTSCSHGAGRRMGRKQAVRELDFDAEVKRLEDQGIVHAVRTKEDLEEATSAYKDILTVMQEQADLVDIVVELKPLGVIKG